MSHFYGTVQGNRGEASKCGSKASGIRTYAASWKGAITCWTYIDKETGNDYVRVEMTTWQGAGNYALLYDGPIGEYKPEVQK